MPITIGTEAQVANCLQEKLELTVEHQRKQYEGLQAYLDKVSELLVDKQLHEKDDPHNESRVMARARTLTILGRFDGERKRTVLRWRFERASFWRI